MEAFPVRYPLHLKLLPGKDTERKVLTSPHQVYVAVSRENFAPLRRADRPGNCSVLREYECLTAEN